MTSVDAIFILEIVYSGVLSKQAADVRNQRPTTRQQNLNTYCPTAQLQGTQVLL